MSEPIYDRVMDDLTRLFTHHRYHEPNTTPEATVSLLDAIRTEISNAVTWGEDELRARLPTIAKLADGAEAVAQSAPARAILAAVLSPADEAWIVSVIQRLDQSAHQAGQAAALADSEPAAGEGVPAVPGDLGGPQPAPAGPVVGGQA